MHSKFQVPSKLASQMHVPFVNFEYRDLKVLRLIYKLQANPYFQKILTQARNNIFSWEFLLLLHLKNIFKNTFTCYGPQDPHCGLTLNDLKNLKLHLAHG